jgi:hypothetical protein
MTDGILSALTALGRFKILYNRVSLKYKKRNQRRNGHRSQYYKASEIFLESVTRSPTFNNMKVRHILGTQEIS